MITKPEKVSSSPVHLQIEPTTNCNYNCQACPRFGVLKDFKNMNYDDFCKIIDQIKPKKVTFSGLGEPLIHPDCFKMIKYLKDREISVRLTTNGSILNEKNSERLIDLNVDIINISLDAATQETYDKVRDKKSLEKVKENILLLQDLKKSKNSEVPILRTSFVIQKDNFREMKQFIDFAKSLGIRNIFFQPIAFHFIVDRKEKLVSGITKDELFKELKEAEGYAEDMNTNLSKVIVDFPLYWKIYEEGDVSGRKCLFPWISTYVTVDGDVKLCCSLVSDEGTMGNIFEQDFSEIWNGEKYRAMRRIFKKGGRPCLSCRRCVPQKMSDFMKHA